jgi:N-acetylglucosamine-6-phosphate deacetylase
LFRQLELVEKYAKDFPVIRGVHLEGPFFSLQYKGAMPPQHLQKPNVELFKKYQEKAGGLIKLITIAPELEGAVELTKAAVKSGVAVSLGHSGASFDVARLCVEAGAKSFTHMFNAMRGIDHHDGSIAAYALYSDKYCEAITDGKHLEKNILKMLSKIKKNRLIGVTDSLSCAGLPDGNYFLAGTPIYVKNGDARLTQSNTRAGSTLNIFDGYKNYIKFCGESEEEAIKVFTKTPAKMLSMDKERGSVKEGKFADFIVVAEQKVTQTYIEGKLQFKG